MRSLLLTAGTGAVALASLSRKSFASDDGIPQIDESTLSIPFVENAGQTDAPVAYHALMSAGARFVMKDGLVGYALHAPGREIPSSISVLRGSDPRSWRPRARAFDLVNLGDIYIVSDAESAAFPGTAGGAQPVMSGRWDGFVARISTDLRCGPSITPIKSKTSKPGSRATIKGSGYSKKASANRVYLGTKLAAVKEATEKSLKVAIPASLKKGSVSVHVEANGVDSNSMQFTVK